MTGKRLRKVRESRSLSVDALAALVGCAPNAIMQYERGNLKPGADIIAILARALNVPREAISGHRDLHNSSRLKAADRKTVSVKEVAASLGICNAAAYDLVHQGRIQSIRVGRRLIVPKAALDQFLGQK